MSATQFKSPVVRWIDHRLPVFSMLHHTAHDYPTPKNLNYMWNFGSLAGLSLAIMIVTGIVLAMSYRLMLITHSTQSNGSCAM